MLTVGLLRAALLCLHNAKEGGLSSWSSSISVHNEIVRRRPDLARLLAGPWFFDRKARTQAQAPSCAEHQGLTGFVASSCLTRRVLKKCHNVACSSLYAVVRSPVHMYEMR